MTKAKKTSLVRLNRDILHEVQILMKDDHQGQKWSKKNYRHGFTSYGSVYRLFAVSPTFAELKKQIDFHVSLYLKNLGANSKLSDLEMSSLWANYMPKGSYHTMHIHPASVISGTYYAQVPLGTSPLKIEDPRLNFMMNSPLIKTESKPHLQRFFSVKPKVGEIILFESWVRHEVPENEASQPRISISFNYDWKGRSAQS